MGDRYTTERLQRNQESLNNAEHHAEPWGADEVEFLMVFFAEAVGLPAAEAEVAEALGRTIEACRQRFYMARRGECASTSIKRVTTTRTVTTTATTTEYVGVNDDPSDQWWSPDYYR